MRPAIMAVLLTVLALLAFSSGSTTSPGAAVAFAAQPVADEIPPIYLPCTRYCNGTTVKYCGTTPSGNVGCDHIVVNFCVFTLCGKQVDPEPQE